MLLISHTFKRRQWALLTSMLMLDSSLGYSEDQTARSWSLAATTAAAQKNAPDQDLIGAPGAVYPTVETTMSLTDSRAIDQDDVCFWINPNDASQSRIITSDKAANCVFVYDLDGNVRQRVPVPKPGNIDIRQNVSLGGKSSDIVVVNQRSEGFALVVFRVLNESGTLERIDKDCSTAPNYGGCLFQSAMTGDLYFFCTSEEGTIHQYRLNVHSDGLVHTSNVRELKTGKCEGAVANDKQGHLYVSDETRGIWRFEAEPNGSSDGILIASVGENELKGDVEGLCVCTLQNGHACLIVSDQGSDRFAAFDCATNKFLGAFGIDGVGETDGIDLCEVSLGPKFPGGAFACHNGRQPTAVSVTSWLSIQSALLTKQSR